jgi:myxalamid-type polyketide synthase MxaE and MxaD
VKETAAGDGRGEPGLEEAQRQLGDNRYGGQGPTDHRVSVAVSMSLRLRCCRERQPRCKLRQSESQGVVCRWIKVDYASHSPQVEPLVPEMLRVLEGIHALPPKVPVYSTVTGEKNGIAFDTVYWARNLREPVLFSTALQRLLEDDHEIFIEVSPHPLLLSSIRQWIQELDKVLSCLPRQQ